MYLKLQSIIPLYHYTTVFGHRTVPTLRMNDDIDRGQRCLRRDKNSRWWQVVCIIRDIKRVLCGGGKGDDHEDHG